MLSQHQAKTEGVASWRIRNPCYRPVRWASSYLEMYAHPDVFAVRKPSRRVSHAIIRQIESAPNCEISRPNQVGAHAKSMQSGWSG
jgi:hypothetical protein